MRCRPTHLAWERGAQSGREGLGPGAWWGWRKRGKAGEGEELKSGVLGAAGMRGGEASHGRLGWVPSTLSPWGEPTHLLQLHVPWESAPLSLPVCFQPFLLPRLGVYSSCRQALWGLSGAPTSQEMEVG